MSKDKWLDEIYDWFDRCFCVSAWDEADAKLASMPVETWDEDRIVGVLCATLPAKDQLPSRKEFIQRAYIRLSELPESKDALTEIFQGLE